GLLLERAHAEGVRPAQLDGILAYHVTHWAESIAIRAGYSYAAGPIDDARHVAERLAAGDRDLLLGAASYR
ncbi:MAG TPA: hypothetical protein VFQ22_00570, partial [Longimicrobiales bacterium]|nr:hypothetical protein [Longimicrobiales bacterium]